MSLVPFDGAEYPPRKWHAEAMPLALRALADGKRAIIRACTGAGKTYLTTELARLAVLRGRQTVVLVPTEALVEQTASAMRGRVPAVARWYGRVKGHGTCIVCCYPSLSTLLLELASRGQQVDFMIADECHGTEAEKRLADIRRADPTWLLGLTATPYRSDESQALSLWDEVVYEYGLSDATRDGILVPIRIWECEGDDRTLVDDALDSLYRRLPRRPDDRSIRPGVVSAINVEDAERYLQRLRADGWRADVVHYRVGRDETTERIDRLRRGELDMLVHVQMLSEGVDLPWLWWTALRRPLTSRVALVQTVGRVVRVDRHDPHKTLAYVLDPHGLCDSMRLIHDARVGDGHAMQDDDGRARSVADAEPCDIPVTLEGRTIKVRASEAERLWREMAVGLEVRGMIQPGVARGRWSRRPATDAQRQALDRLRWATRHLPDEWRDTWRQLATHDDLSRGCASDLIDIIRAAADGGADARATRRRWVLDLELTEQPNGRLVRAETEEET